MSISQIKNIRSQRARGSYNCISNYCMFQILENTEINLRNLYLKMFKFAHLRI